MSGRLGHMSDAPVFLTRPVPYYAQWESAALVPDIIGGTLSAADDPLWQRSGAASREEYAFWSWRLCGMACLRMALEGARGQGDGEEEAADGERGGQGASDAGSRPPPGWCRTEDHGCLPEGRQSIG